MLFPKFVKESDRGFSTDCGEQPQVQTIEWIYSLVTSGVDDSEISGNEDDILGVVGGWEEDETHNPDVPAVSHRRGMTPFVFVPFEEVLSSTFFILFLIS